MRSSVDRYSFVLWPCASCLNVLAVISLSLPFIVCAQEELNDLVGNGAVVLLSPVGEAVVSLNADTPLIPASLLKIPLAQAALSALGEDYRFETQFYRNECGDLLVRGLGDPFLVSEDIAVIAKRLSQQGLQRIQRLVMDDSAFEPELDLPREAGVDDPYAARNSALAVNFNTVSLAWNAEQQIISGEQETPLTEVARLLGKTLAPGQPRRVNMGANPELGLAQVQQLFAYFLNDAGVVLADKTFYREVLTDEWTLIYRYRSSRPLRDIVAGMLRYSNNFIANQLFLALGAHASGYPVTSEAAQEALERELAELYGSGFGRNSDKLFMTEGSGLARHQRTTASGFVRVLERFAPYANLLPAFDGALRKSGTLTGVFNYAGFFTAAEGLYPFVIITNQAENNRDELLNELERVVSNFGAVP